MSGQQTAQSAEQLLIGKNIGFMKPSQRQRVQLASAFAAQNKIIYGKAFDLLMWPSGHSFEELLQNPALFSSLVVYEVKSTNQASIGPTFKGYFFDLTTAELLVAQSLGPQFRFVFVNTVTGHHIEMTIQDLFGRAHRIYPKWAITLGTGAEGPSDDAPATEESLATLPDSLNVVGNGGKAC